MIAAKLRMSHNDSCGWVAVSYEPKVDPLALVFDFPEDVRWLIGRDLLADGCEGPAGVGDARVWPDRRSGEVVIRLTGADRDDRYVTADLRADRGGLLDVLDRSYRLVPRGGEGRWLDMDGLIENLLEDAWPTW